MLGKLLKHELKATSRLLLPLYAIMLVLSILNRIFIEIDLFKKAGFFKIINSFTLTTFILTIIVILISTQILVIYRFYKNLTTNEGYLMFTLPVNTFDLINSKLIALVLWTLFSFIATFIVIIIAFVSKKDISTLINFIKTNYHLIKINFDIQPAIFILEVLLLIFVSIPFKAISFYLAIAIGQSFTKNKILSSILSFIAINIILQFLTLIFFFIIALISGNSVDSLNTLPNILLPSTIIISIVLGGLQYFLTNYFLSKKLNLE